MPTRDTTRLFPAANLCATGFEPSAALSILDDAAEHLGVEAGPAWEAAWIACLTDSPRWAETARQEFVRATARR